MSFHSSTTMYNITNVLVSIGLKHGVQLRVTTTLMECGGNVVSNIANPCRPCRKICMYIFCVSCVCVRKDKAYAIKVGFPNKA